MGVRTAIKPLGSRKGRYKKGTVLCNLSNGQSSRINIKRGLYFIRGQGAGGWGGNNFMANGGGGGSGAGFEGYIYFRKDIDNVEVISGVAPTTQAAGNPTIISGVLMLGGGAVGGYNNNTGGDGGIYQFIEDRRWYIKSFRVAQNGENGRGASNDGNYRSGGNSVLTGNGGGLGNAAATAAGAGGGGGYAWHTAGQAGGGGELLIRYERPYI